MKAVNLIPADQRAGASVGAGRSQGAVYAVVVLLGGVALLALLYGLAHHQVADHRSQVASLTARAQHATAETSQLAPYTSFIALHESREQAVMQLVNSRFDWAHAFHELGRVLPPGVSISSLTGTVGSATKGGAAGATSSSSAAGAAVTGASAVASATPPGSVPTFALTGCAVSQQTVALLLNRLHLIDGVSEVTLESSSKGGASGGGAGAVGSGSCPVGDPAFSVSVTFQPLPASSTPASAGAGSTATTAAASGGVGG